MQKILLIWIYGCTLNELHIYLLFWIILWRRIEQSLIKVEQNLESIYLNIMEVMEHMMHLSVTHGGLRQVFKSFRVNQLTLCILMDSSFWCDTINLE